MMSKHTTLLRAALAPLVLVTVIAGCQKKDEVPPASRQVELAPMAAANPQLADTARAAAGASSPTADRSAGAEKAPKAKPAPVAAKLAPASAASAAPAPSPAATPAAPAAPATGVIAGGTSLSATMRSRVCTNTHRVGDRVTAGLAGAVTGTNGATIPVGASVTLRVTESARGENGKEGIRLAVEPVAVAFGGASYAISGSASFTSMETVRAQTTGDQAKKVAIGAAIGAIAGQLLGRKTKTTVVGAAVGAAAGGAVAVGTADWNGCLGQGGVVTIRLTSPVIVLLAK